MLVVGRKVDDCQNGEKDVWKVGKEREGKGNDYGVGEIEIFRKESDLWREVRLEEI